ncbi:hypothetical protein BASA83_011896 [Batrachochytrium salamandrivorans]|nr:hypothetical protein BASA83_011896 [Batrachochytrium salamandrivorans]
MGKAYYELELVGGTSHTSHHARHINKGIRLFTGARLSTAIGPFWLKLGLGHFSLAHWYHGAVGTIPRWFWSQSDQTAVQEQILADTTDQTKGQSSNGHSFALMGDSANMWRLCIAPKVCHSTIIEILLDSSRIPVSINYEHSGTRYLMLRAWMLSGQQEKPFRLAYYHWPSHSVWTSTSNSEIPTQIAGRALDPGVENVYTWLRGGVLNGEADLDQRWLDGTVEHESMGTRHDNRALAARLADFLQVAYRQYQSTLWKYTGIALWKLAN